jgi:DNA-directed RNA polymerase alpha subunit
MNPNISNISEEGDVYKFTLSGINVSLANAIRRTILSDIPINVIKTDNYLDNQCNILINNTRLHNEILKQRISCIPIHIKELDLLPDKYILEVDVENNGSNTIYVTTEDFKIRNKNNDNYLTIEETRKIFPPCQKTNSFIDFARLRPKISSTIPGEHIKLTAEFSVGTAKDNSMYNVVSKCSYGNTLDPLKISEFWEQYEQKLLTEKMTKEEIEFQKKNFYLLDAQRHFIPDSFDFVIQTLGIYDNKEIVKKSCIIIQNKLIELIKAVDSDTIPINYSETTMDYCFDIILENEDYTIGKVLEYLLYEKYYVTDKVFSFCGFKKFHPHNTDSVIRVAYVSANDKNMVKQHLRLVCIDASEIFKRIYELF